MARLDARNLLWHPESLGSDSSDIMESRMKQQSWQLLPEPLTHGSTSHLLEVGRGVERALQKEELMILLSACEIGKKDVRSTVSPSIFLRNDNLQRA